MVWLVTGNRERGHTTVTIFDGAGRPGRQVRLTVVKSRIVDRTEIAKLDCQILRAAMLTPITVALHTFGYYKFDSLSPSRIL